MRNNFTVTTCYGASWSCDVLRTNRAGGVLLFKLHKRIVLHLSHALNILIIFNIST
nr:MAG TPA: hypothetical protein [Caudoviricetes sp.]